MGKWEKLTFGYSKSKQKFFQLNYQVEISILGPFGIFHSCFYPAEMEHWGMQLGTHAVKWAPLGLVILEPSRAPPPLPSAPASSALYLKRCSFCLKRTGLVWTAYEWEPACGFLFKNNRTRQKWNTARWEADAGSLAESPPAKLFAPIPRFPHRDTCTLLNCISWIAGLHFHPTFKKELHYYTC